MKETTQTNFVSTLGTIIECEDSNKLVFNIKKPSLQRFKINDEHYGYRPFMNDSLNSRSAMNFTQGDWKIEKSNNFNDGIFPQSIIGSYNCILGHSSGAWQLFSDELENLGIGTNYSPGITIDNHYNLIFTYNNSGAITAHQCSDGKKKFTAFTSFGMGYRREYTALNGSKILSVGVEEILDKSSQKKPELATVEIIDLGDSLEINGDGRATSAKTTSFIIRKSADPIFTVINNNSIFLASNNTIYELDFNLKIKKQLNGTFTPLKMSIDEYSRIHLIVSLDSDSKRFLWIITPEGEIQTVFELPDNMRNLVAPPIIGYDHAVYLISETCIYSIGSNGDLIWERKAEQKYIGAIITENDFLIVSDGQHLVTFDTKGQKSIVHIFKEQLFTPPLLIKSGILSVATQKNIFLLTRQ